MNGEQQEKKAATVLPAGYAEAGRLDLMANRALALLLNVVGLLLLVGAGWLALAILPYLGVELPEAISFSGAEALLFLLGMMVLFMLLVVVHEAIHGMAFWMITGARPVFGHRLPFYAYAAAPGWYLTRAQHLLVALAPLLVITVVGGLLLPFLPGNVALILLIGIVVNIASSVGDMAAILWLLLQPPRTLVEDSGDVITAYRPVA